MVVYVLGQLQLALFYQTKNVFVFVFFYADTVQYVKKNQASINFDNYNGLQNVW